MKSIKGDVAKRFSKAVSIPTVSEWIVQSEEHTGRARLGPVFSVRHLEQECYRGIKQLQPRTISRAFSNALFLFLMQSMVV